MNKAEKECIILSNVFCSLTNERHGMCVGVGNAGEMEPQIAQICADFLKH